jgi:predicted transcriptional regulator
LVVTRSSGEYLGILTVKDVLTYLIYLRNQAAQARKSEDWLTQLQDQCEDGSLTTVNDALVRYDISVRPNQELLELIKIMDDKDLEIIPVADAGRVIGLVRNSDVLAEIVRGIG